MNHIKFILHKYKSNTHNFLSRRFYILIWNTNKDNSGVGRNQNNYDPRYLMRSDKDLTNEWNNEPTKGEGEG